MSRQQPTLFEPAALVSPETRAKWRRYVDFLWEHGQHVTTWEAEFLTHMKQLVDAGQDLELKQSGRLAKIFHREEERLG